MFCWDLSDTQKMRIKTRILFAGVSIILLTIATVIGVTRESTDASSFIKEAKSNRQQLLLLTELRSSVRDQILAVSEFLATKNSSKLTEFKKAEEQTLEKFAALAVSVKEEFFETEYAISALKNHQDYLDVIKNSSTKINLELHKLIQTESSIKEKTRKNSMEEVNKIYDTDFNNFIEQITKATNLEVKEIEDAERSLLEEIFNLLVAVLIGGLAVVVFTAIQIFTFTKNIADKIKKIRAVTTKISSGDFGELLKNHGQDELDELSQDINNMSVAIQESKKMLATSAKMSSLGEMAGGIAHEINNPVGIIQGKAKLLIKYIHNNTYNSNLGPEASQKALQEELQKIVTQTDRIAKIISGLKSFSRSAEKDPTTSANLNNLISNVQNLCSERFRHHLIKLETSPIPEVHIECREVQIEQVLLNLLNNAYDAVVSLTEKWIRLDLKIIDQTLQITLTDSGTGIPSHIVEKMMQPFFSTKEVGKGTGLGLSISKGIIEQHQGNLRYDSTSTNTRFVIELPLKQTQS